MGIVIRFDHAINRLRRTGCAPKSAYTVELIRVLNLRTGKKKIVSDNGSSDLDEMSDLYKQGNMRTLTKQDLINAGFVIRDPKK